MQYADSTARSAPLLGDPLSLPLAGAPARDRARSSGFFTALDEYAGLDRLDRAELDETDG